MKNKIDKLRENLHRAIESEDKELLIKISQELDKLIVNYSKLEDNHSKEIE